MSAQIKAISYWLPPTCLTNEALCKEFPDYTPEQLFKMSGVRKRYVRQNGEIASDMAEHCLEAFFEEHKIARDTFDFLMFCGSGIDYVGPATACMLQDKVGLPNTCGSIDIPMGCSGFTNGVALAKGMIDSGQCKNVLFATADIPTSVLHPEDLYLRVLFSDAACVTWIGESDESAIGKTIFGTDGSGAKNLIVNGSGIRNPRGYEWMERYRSVGGMLYGRMEMKGDAILRFSLQCVPELIDRILAENKFSFDEIDKFVFHQPSGVILDFLGRKLKIPKEKYLNTIESVGNTVSVSIPLTLKMSLDNGSLKKGENVLICGFGIGYSWSGTIITV